MIGRKEGKEKDKKEEGEGRGKRKQLSGRGKGRKAGRQADKKEGRKEGGRSGAGGPPTRGGPAPTALTLKCSVMTMNIGSKAAPMRKGMLIFPLSGAPRARSRFEFKTTLSQPSKARSEWKATSAPWPCPTSKLRRTWRDTEGCTPGLTPRGQFPPLPLRSSCP